jgi:hypothetical protein
MPRVLCRAEIQIEGMGEKEAEQSSDLIEEMVLAIVERDLRKGLFIVEMYIVEHPARMHEHFRAIFEGKKVRTRWLNLEQPWDEAYYS